GNDLVEPADGADAEDASPFLVFLKNLEQLRLRLVWAQLLRIVPIGKLQHEPRRMQNQLEQRQRPGTRRERAVSEVGKILAPARRDLGRITEAQEIVLVELLLL